MRRPAAEVTELRVRAKDVYLRHGGRDLDAIAVEVGTTRQSIAAWRDTEGWDALVNHHRGGGEGPAREVDLETVLRDAQDQIARIDRAMAEMPSQVADPQRHYVRANYWRLVLQALAARAAKLKPEDVRKAIQLYAAVLEEHPAVGPVIRQYRGELDRLFAARLEALSGEAA